jgi:nitronate monooxygenase
MDIPLIVAPMFLVSNAELVLESCKAGLVGSYPALNSRTSEEFEEWLQDMQRSRAEYEREHPGQELPPYAVNLIVNPEINSRIYDDLALCVKYEVPIVITSLGAVSQLVDAVHGYGGLVFHDVTQVRHAQKAADAGVDGIIAVSEGAGGHSGTQDPETLIADIKSVFDGIIILAGGMSDGQDIVNAQQMGADFAYMGTRFIATEESDADVSYKKMLCDIESDDIVYTSDVSGVPANFIRQSLDAAGIDTDNPSTDVKAQKPNLADEQKAWKTIWSAGYGVDNIDDIPTTADLAARIKSQYQAALYNLQHGQPGQKPNQPPPP